MPGTRSGDAAPASERPVSLSLTCPRCSHLIPNDLRPGVHRGARSRVAAGVEVCSACGFHEAMLALVGAELPSQVQWPISVPWAVTTPHSELRVLRCLGLQVSATAEFENALRVEEEAVRSRLTHQKKCAAVMSSLECS